MHIITLEEINQCYTFISKLYISSSCVCRNWNYLNQLTSSLHSIFELFFVNVRPLQDPVCVGTAKTVLREQMEDGKIKNTSLYVFCVHSQGDQITPLIISSIMDIEMKKDTWMLAMAITLQSISFVCLMAGEVRVVCQNKKTFTFNYLKVETVSTFKHFFILM